MKKEDKRVIQLLQKIVRYNSENPPGNEWALAKFIEQDLRSLGLEVKIYTYAKARPNIVATLKGTLPRQQAKNGALLLTPHFDTVPIGKGWKQDPLGGKIIGNKIYGRGTSDDKVNVAVAMDVMRRLVEKRVRLKKDCIMAATVDEETGSQYGIIPLLKKGILKPKAALILDANEFDATVAQKGLFHTRIQIFGKQAHGAYNWRGVNAIEIAARVIEKIKKHQFTFKRHPLLRPPTMNIGTIHGGDKVNMVAGFCEFSLDNRFMPGMTSTEVLKIIKKIIRSETKRFQVIISDSQKPYEISAEHPFVKTYLQTAVKMKIKSTLCGSEGATVMTFFQEFKIPAFATGFGAHGTAHTVDEYAKVDLLIKGADFLEQFVKDYDEVE